MNIKAATPKFPNKTLTLDTIMEMFTVDDTAKVEGLALREVVERRGQRCIMAVADICIYKESQHPPTLEQCAKCGSWVHTVCTGIPSDIFPAEQYFCCEAMEETAANKE